MARLTRAESQQKTREKLLNAAATVFLRDGYAASSVEEIAEQAELSKGAIYSNFESKEDLFLALLERDMKREQHFWRDATLSCRTKKALLDTLAEGNRCFEEKYKVLLLTTEFQMVAGRNPEVAEKFAGLFRGKRREVIRILRRLSAFEDRKPPERIQDIATALMALGCGLAQMHAADPKSVPRGMLTRTARLFLECLTRE